MNLSFKKYPSSFPHRYYQTPRLWLFGYDEARKPLTGVHIKKRNMNFQISNSSSSMLFASNFSRSKCSRTLAPITPTRPSRLSLTRTPRCTWPGAINNPGMKRLLALLCIDLLIQTIHPFFFLQNILQHSPMPPCVRDEKVHRPRPEPWPRDQAQRILFTHMHDAITTQFPDVDAVPCW
jgi:hypothetical protein